MKISFIAYPGCSAWSIIGSYEILQKAIYMARKNPSAFKAKTIPEILLVSATTDKEVVGCHGIKIICDATIYDSLNEDLIVISAFEIDYQKVLAENGPLIEWLKLKIELGVDVATVCTGALLLAETGYLNGKPATTHWLIADVFKKRYPKVILEFDRMILDHQGIYMSGGATAFHNLMIYLVEKFMSKSLSLTLSKILLVDINRDKQSAYAIFAGQKKHGDNTILNLQEIIERNVYKRITLFDLANESNLTQRTLLRRFKKATGNTPFEYIQRVKVEEAKKFLENERMSFEEISFKVSYEDVNAFRKVFRKYVGLSPINYRKRYQVAF